MLDRLPTELLLFIIESTIPPDHAYSRYKERQEALKRYCLVCRRLREVAQPVLQRVFRWADKGFLRLLKSQPGFEQHISVLQVHGQRPPAASTFSTSFEQSFKLMAQAKVSTARLEHFREDLLDRHAQAMASVVHLEMSHLRLAFSRATFPNITTLALHDMSQHRSFLTAAAFPNLRALYSTMTVYEQGWPTSLFLLSDGQSQLDMLQVHLCTHRLFPYILFRLPTPVLLTCDLDDFRDPPESVVSSVIHLQINAFGKHDLPTSLWWMSHDIHCLALCIQHDLPQLLSLSLPSALHPSSPLPYQTDSARSTLLNSCKGRNITVIWRFDSHDAEDDVGVSKEFWAYAKELKRKKEEEAAATAAPRRRRPGDQGGRAEEAGGQGGRSRLKEEKSFEGSKRLSAEKWSSLSIASG